MLIRKHKNKAQGLNEYALTGGLVVIACIMSLSVLGSNVSDMLGGTISKRSTTLAAGATANNPNILPTTQVAANLSPNSAFGRTLTVQLPNGESQQFRIPDPRTIIDTDGTDGVTKAYLAQLDQLIQAFKKVLPENDPRIAALEKLSRRGHLIADEQRKAEKANENGFYADTGTLIFNQARDDKSPADFKNLDQCTNFGYSTSSAGINSAPSVDPCTGKLSFEGRTKLDDAQRTLVQNFALHASQTRNMLNDPSFSKLIPLFDYFAGNIIQSGISTRKSAVVDRSFGPQQANKSFLDKPELVQKNQQRKELAKSAFIEVQANGLCGMSGFETCQRQNGQASQNNANTTSPINTPDLNPVNTTHGGSTAGASSLSTRRSW